MTFNSNQPREADGKFGEKTGAAPDIALSSFPEGFPTEAPVSEKVEWALRNGAELTLRTKRSEFTESGLDLAREWNDLPLGAITEVTAVRLLPEEDRVITLDRVKSENPFISGIPDPVPAAVRVATEKLRVESLDEAGVTLNDIYALRSAANRAEYRLTEYDAEAFLAEKHPEARGLIVAFDDFSGEPYIAGVEVDDADPDSGRNYGTIKPLTGEYEDINSWANNFSSSLARFENEEMFDEYGTVLIDDNSAYGEFTDVEGDLEVGESRIYRFAERTV